MNNYIVLYRESIHDVLSIPLEFHCQAEDSNHAEEQCLDANPNCDIVWLYEGNDYRKAISSWLNYDSWVNYDNG